MAEERVRIFIFPETTPWGVIKHATKGNIYTNVVSFPDKKTSTRKDFINRYMMDNNHAPGVPLAGNFNDYATALNRAKFISFNPINEISFTFRKSLDPRHLNGRSRKQYLNADYCVVQKPNDSKEYFYTLQVVNERLGYVEYLAELDVFFTYNLDDTMFYPDAYNFVEKAHRVRFKKKSDGTFDKDAPLWDVILKNNTALEPSRLLRVYEPNFMTNYDVNRTGTFTSAAVRLVDKTIDNLKWAVFYINRKEQATARVTTAIGRFLSTVFQAKLQEGLNSGFETFISGENQDLNTNLGYLQEKYGVIILPYSDTTDEVYISKTNSDKTVDAAGMKTIEIINTLTKDKGDYYIKVATLYDLGVSLANHFDLEVEYKNGVISYDFRAKNVSFDDCPVRVVGARLKDKTSYLNVISLKNIHLIKPDVANMYLTYSTLLHKEPALFHPKVHHYALKSWDGTPKLYSLPRLALSNGAVQLKVFNFFTPTDSTLMYEMEHKTGYQARPLFKGEYLLVNSDDEISTRQTKLDEFLRDNKTVFNTTKRFNVEQIQLRRALSYAGLGLGTLGGAGGLFKQGSVALGGIGALAGSVLQSELQERRVNALYNAQLTDLKNQLPSIKLGNVANANTIIDTNFAERTSGVVLLEMVPEAHELEQLTDYIRNYGYDVNENLKLTELVNTRRHFQYFQAQNVFNSIKLQVSPRVKQIISSAFSEGVTAWYYRSSSQWKGVNSFDADNSEV